MEGPAQSEVDEKDPTFRCLTDPRSLDELDGSTLVGSFSFFWR